MKMEVKSRRGPQNDQMSSVKGQNAENPQLLDLVLLWVPQEGT
jgi:hypothetical protein